MRLHHSFLILALTGFSGQAYTISTHVSCPGYDYGGPGISHTQCSYDANNGAWYSTAYASAGNGSVYASADNFGPVSASASASYHAVLTMTVFGGEGIGYLLPTYLTAHESLNHCCGSADARFLDATPDVTVPQDAPCWSFRPLNGPPRGACISFIFGQADTYTVDLYASASGRGDGTASFQDSFAFWDTQGNLLSNVQYTLTDVDQPEPSSKSLAFLGLAAVAIIYRLTRCAPGHSNCAPEEL